MPSTPLPSKAVAEDDFAVVLDRERRFIVDSGTYSAMVERASVLNTTYQSTAYVPQKWIEGRIW